jgi:hypothetical protein
MLPMRCACSVLIFAALVGCKNQSAPLTNPFLTPDRVPPPSTRVLMPGTAQPYYSGDPMPTAGAATLPPGGAPPATYGVPQPLPGAVVPGTAYPAGPVTPAAPTTPPGGWGAYPSQANTDGSGSSAQNLALESSAGDSVRVPGDEQGLRFQPPTPQPILPPDAPLFAAAQANAAQPHLPKPAMVPPAQDPRIAAAPGGSFTPNAGAQAPVQQATYETPASPSATAGAPQRLAIREITSAEFLDSRQPSSPTTAAVSGSDGFRPQGSSPPAVAEESSPQEFRPPEIRRESVANGTGDGRFGVGAQQEWLRGQLEYWPESGEWSIRYMSSEGPTDQIGGRVLIDNPQVLGNLPPGEFVVVHGQLYGRQIDASSYRPAYRVAAVERQRR